MKKTLSYLHPLIFLGALAAFVQAASGATTFVWTNALMTMSPWTGAAGVTNWTPNGTPGSGDTAVLGLLGTTVGSGTTINNSVSNTTTVATLQITNATSGTWTVTQIPTNTTLTVSGTMTVGTGIQANSQTTSAAVNDAGTLIVTGGLSVGNNGSANADTGTILDLSGLSNFVFSASSGTITVGTGNRSAANWNLAAGSNYITAGTMNLNVASSSSSASGTVNLGSGTNIIYVGTLSTALQRNSCTIQFPGTTGGLRLRGVAGTDTSRATMTVGNRTANGSSGTSTGTLSLNGHPVDMKLGTLTVGQATVGTPNIGVGIVQFDTGTIDATTVNMAIVSGTGTATANGSITVGTSGTLVAGSGGISLANQSSTGPATGVLNIQGGTVNCSGNIVKTTAAGSGTVVNGGLIHMLGGTIGSLAAPIDNLVLSNNCITTFEDIGQGLTNAFVTTLTIDPSSTTNVITIDFLPGIASYPATFRVISYTNLVGTFNIGVSNLPGAFTGYLTNDTSNPAFGQVNLVLLSGIISKADLWTGATNANFDTTTSNWLSSATVATYNQGDFITFDDTAVGSTTVNLAVTALPGSMTVSNNTKSYTFNGGGGIRGVTGLTKQGTASLTLDNGGAVDFVGNINIAAGSVQVGNNDANGGLGNSALTLNGALTFSRTDTPTLPNVMSGGGKLIQNGTGILTVSGLNSSFTGAVAIVQGTLKLGSAPALGTTNAGTAIASGASLDLGGFALTNVPVTVAGAGAGGTGAISNSGSSIFPALTFLTLTNNTTIGGNGRWDLRAPGGTTGDPATAKLSTSGQSYNLTKIGTNFIGVVSVTVDSALGNIDIQGGTLDFEGDTTSLGDPTKTVTIRSNADFYFFNATNRLNKGIVFQSGGILENNAGANTIIGSVTLAGSNVFNAGGVSMTLTGPIGGSTTTATKMGSGYLILAGTNTYTGPTVVTNGTLAINGANNGGGLLTNYPNATIVGTGTNTGPVAISGTINPGDVSVAGTFTCGALTLQSNANLVVDLGSSTTIGGGVNDLLVVNGNLSASNITVTVNPIQGNLVSGSYRLINYSGTLTGGFNPNVVQSTGGASRYSLALDTSTAHQVNLVVSGSAAKLKWTSTADNNWDIGITANWLNLGTSLPDDFFNGDSVLLDDTGGLQTGLVISTNVAPSVITNNSSSGGNNFIISGTGKITGSGGIVKQGTSTLQIGTANDYRGLVVIQQGTLQTASSTALGATNGSTIISNGATLDVFGVNLGSEPVIAVGPGVTNGGAIYNSNTNQINALRFVTLTGDTYFGGSARWDIRGSPASLMTGGQPYNITKVGPNQVSLVAVNPIDPALGNVDIQGGIFAVQTSTVQLGDPTKTITVHSGATLDVYQLTAGPLNKNIVFQDGSTFFGENGTPTNAGLISLQGTVSFNVNNAVTLTCTNVISGSGSITKTNNGRLSLLAPNSYTGSTIIKGGTVALLGSGSISASTNITLTGTALDVTGRSDNTLTLASGQTLAGSGGVLGSISAGPGAVIIPGDVNSNLLVVTTNLSLSGNSNTFFLNLGGADTMIIVSNNLNLSSVSTLFVSAAGDVNVGDTHTLIIYSNALTGGAANLNVVAPRGFGFSLVDPSTTPGLIQITVTVVPQKILWRGGAPGSQTLWNTTAQNWVYQNNPGIPTNFYTGAPSYFDDSPNTNLVTLVGALDPLFVEFDNASTTFTLVGAGSITGSGGLAMTQPGTVVLANSGSNDFTGDITLNNSATMQVGTNTTSGNVGTISGIHLTNSAFVFDRSDTLNVPNVFDGNGNITNLGAGTTILSANNSGFSGSVQVPRGTMRVNNEFALGGAVNGGLTVAQNATLDLGGLSLAANALNLSNETVTVSGQGVGGLGAIINSSTNQQQNALRTVVLTGDTWFGGTATGNWRTNNNPGRWDIRGPITNNPVASLSTGGQPFNLYKISSNEVSIVCVAIDATPQASLANIDIQNGRLQFESGTSSLGDVNSNLTVEAGATVGFYQTGAGSNFFAKQFILNGDGVNITLTNENGTTTIGGTMTLNNACILGIGGTAFTNSCDPVSGAGSLLKTGTGRLVLTGTASYTGNTTINDGRLDLFGDQAIPASPRFDLVATTAILDLRNTSGLLTINSGQTVRGSGTIRGSLTANAGSLLLPGETNVIGTLIATNVSTLGGLTVMQLDRSTAAKSCALSSTNITLGGTIAVTNIGPTIHTGDTFTLFKGSLSGSITPVALPTLWPGLSWNTGNLNSSGTLSVVGAPIQPVITTNGLVGPNFMLSGMGGLAHATYYILSSTNVALPISQWTSVYTNTFDSGGDFSFSTPVEFKPPDLFFILQAQ